MTQDPIGDEPLPPSLRFLKTLVTILMVVMILGLVTMIVLFVIRFGFGTPATKVPLPDAIVLPAGTEALSVTWGPDHYAIITADKRILVFDLEGRLLQTVAIE